MFIQVFIYVVIKELILNYCKLLKTLPIAVNYVN